MINNSNLRLFAGGGQGSTPNSSPPCGFLCKITRAVVVAAATAIGGPIGGAIGTFLASQIHFRELDFSDTLLTLQEQVNLTAWFEKLFMPKFESVMKKANSIFDTNNTIVQLQLINEVNQELAILRAFLKNENTGVSQAYVDERYMFCEPLIKEIEVVIFKALESSPNTFEASNINIESSSALLQPLVATKKYFGTATIYSLQIIADSNNDTPIEAPTPTNVNPKESKKLWYALGIGGLLLLVATRKKKK